jgi:outer membrane lipoprotein-sorting protein
MVMKRILTMLVFAAFSELAVAQSGASTPSVDSILDRFVQALGGHAALEKITTMAFTGVMNIPGAQGPGKATEYFEHPDHFAAITEIPGYGTVRTVCDGKTAWNVDPKKGVTDFSGAQLADLRHRADIHWNLKLREFYPGLTLTGRENVGGRDAWVLESTAEGWTYRFFFDAGTGLLTRFDTDTHKPGGSSSVVVGDYRKVGPIKFSFAASMTSPRGSWSRQLSEVKLNVPIDGSVFAKP